MPSSFDTSHVQSNPSPDFSTSPKPGQSCEQGAPDPAALAAALQQIAQSLLAQAQSAPQAGPAPQGRPAPASAPRSRPEIRMYSVADYILKEEQALLAAYQAEDWQELFQVARGRFETICTLMRHFHEDQEINGFLLQQIAENLMLPNLELLNRLCSLVADFRAPEEQMI